MSRAAEVESVESLMTAYTDALAEVWAGPREQIGERIIRLFVKYWDDPRLTPHFVGVVQSASTGEAGAAPMRNFLGSQFFAHVGETVPPLNVFAAGSQLIGVVMLRYVLKFEPMASASEDELVAVLGPTIQRYLGGGA
jgi:hypothetical protein